LGEIIERAAMTKGALYHHFDSKQALATAIIEQGADLTGDAFRQVCESSSPAMENLIHGVFVVSDLVVWNKAARTSEQLIRGLSAFNGVAAHAWNCRLDALTTQTRFASEQGDLRDDVDPYAVSESTLAAMLAAQLLPKTADGGAHIKLPTRSLGVLLPAIVADASLVYFREFLAREALRHDH
jgi:AcrR family transcriptional regulator